MGNVTRDTSSGKRFEKRIKDYVVSKNHLLTTISTFFNNRETYLERGSKEKWYIEQPDAIIHDEDITIGLENYGNHFKPRSKDDGLIFSPYQGRYYSQRLEYKYQDVGGTSNKSLYEKIDDNFHEDRFLIIVDGKFLKMKQGKDFIEQVKDRMSRCNKEYHCFTYDEMVKGNLLSNFNL